MKNINHQNIRLYYDIGDNPAIYDTTITCDLPMPKYIVDDKGKLFQKNRTIFELGQESRVAYSEVGVTVLSNVEVVIEAIDVS